MKINILFVIFFLFLTKQAISTTTINVPNGVTLTNYNTLVSNVLYTVNMTFGPITIPSGSTILMQFSIHYTIDTNSINSCQYSLTGVTYTSTLCQPNFNTQNNQYEISFPNIYTNVSNNQASLNLQFRITNPQLATTQYINVYIISSGSTIANGVISIIYIASSLGNCSYISSNDTTGANASRTIGFYPSVPVYAGSIFVMTLPPWFNTISNNPISTAGGSLTCMGISNSDSSNPTCASNIYQDSTTFIYYQQFDVSGLISSNKVLSSSIFFNASLIRNPPSLAPFGPITYQLKIPDPNSGGALVTSQTCTGIYQTVTKMNIPSSITFNINGTLAISTTYPSKNPRLGIRQPFPASTGQFMLSYPSSVQMSYVLSAYPVVATSTSLTFSSVQAGDLIGTGTISITGVTITTPPSSRPFSIVFTTQFLQGGTVYGIDSNSMTLSCLTGTLTSVSLVPTVTNVNAITQYILTFTTVNTLISGSFISINFPSQITATVGNCTTNNSNIICTITNTSYAYLSISGAIPSLSTLRITFPNIKNPKQAQTTSSFQIYTYYDAGTDSMVDKIITGITMTSIANSITSATVTPTSFVTYALTTYTFVVGLVDLIPVNGYIRITFPSTITLGNVSISSASFSTGTCSVSVNSSVVSLLSCFSSDMTNLNVTIVLGGIYNPPSLQPTTTFSISTYGPSGMVNYISSGLIVTMITPATTTSFTINPLSATVHSFQQYNLLFTFAVPHQSGDYLTLTIPSSMAFSNTPTCSAISGLTNISCILLNTTTIQITLSAIPSTNTQIGISTIRNYDIGTSLSFQVFLYNSGSYPMETTSTYSVTYTPTTITTFSFNNNDQIALYEKSNLTLTITTPFTIGSSFASNLTSLLIIPPATFTISSNTTCNPSIGICSIGNTSFSISSVGLSLSSYTVTFSNIFLPYFTPTSTSFTINYLYNGNHVADVSSGVVVSVYCSSPCERCVTTQTACASCLPSPNTAIYLYTVNSSCLTSCPNGYYKGTNNICQICVSPCLWCLDSINCLKCTNITYLYNTSCLTVCPATYYGNSSNICAPCLSPCFNCTSDTLCLSCSINFFTNFTCVNASNCPTGTYGNTLTKSCDSCTSPCLACYNTPTNCTSCVSGFVYYLNTCPNVCPSGYYNSTNFCTGCVLPCGNCTSATACTSCINNFLSNSSCVTSANCPAGTYGNSLLKICDACTSPCLTCYNTKTNCTSCVTGSVYYLNTCPSVCPNTFYNNTNICIACVSPCGNCTSATTCLSCLSNYLSNTACVTASNCQAGTYADNSTMTCTTCPTGCSVCSSLSSCSSCTNFFFFYNLTCMVSCPNSTYISGSICVSCTGNCVTCSGSATSCTSCISPLLLSGTSCVAGCANGTYVSNGNCLACLSTCLTCTAGNTCSSCTGSLYLSSNQCVSSCSAGTYQNLTTNNCSSCSSSCLTCSSTPSNCTGCLPTSVYYSGSCIGSCPTNYFNISNICQTCPNCLSCTSISFCATCQLGYYMLNNVCYSTCPASSIPQPLSLTCTQCNSSCATCSGSTTTCTSCWGSQNLLNGVCLSTCPSGYISSGGKCTASTIGSIVYFPFSITFVVLFIIAMYSKANHSKTESVTALCGCLGFLVWISWLVLVFQAATTDQQLLQNTRSTIIGMGLVGIVSSVIFGIIFSIWVRNYFRGDNGFNEWVNHQQRNLNVYRVIFFMSLFSFASFRIIYCRLFNRSTFSAFFLKGGDLLSATSKFSFLYTIISIFPLIFLSGYIIYIKQQYDQTLINSIDSILLDIILIILLIIDAHSKDESFFDQMLQDQPYLKKLRYDELNHSISSMRDYQDNKKERHKSQILDREKEEYFRTKVNIFQDLNKFGHLNTPMPELPGRGRKIKTLPNDLAILPQFDINQDDIQVVDDQFFFQEEERRRREEEEQRRRQQEELLEEERKRKAREEQEERERQELRRLKQLQDLDQQHQVVFPDLAAIEKVERKGQNMKKSPTHILDKFKKVQDRNISDKDKKKLQDLARKNNLDPEFIAETFGVQKNFNPELLNSIIDKHFHVDRQAVKQLFSSTSNPEILQQMFSKKSNLDADRLRSLLNDPSSAEIIKGLASAEEGLLAPDMVKLLFDSNSKYSETFVKELLKCEGGLDADKVRQLLRDNPDKASREAALKALRKIGGENLENKQLLRNLLGEDSLLQAENFARVVNDLPKKLVEQLFGSKSPTNDIIISKLLNNKKIDLKNLSCILEDPELLEELANALANGDETVSENLLNLLKNGEKLDPALLKEFLRNPTLMGKLASMPIDPAFLSNVLRSGAKTDLSLLASTIDHMSPQQIAEVFQFSPQKNIDYQKMSKLFDFNSKSDPSLIAQLLDPQIVANVYSKSSTTKAEMLNKLVEKGKSINPQQIIKIYGDDQRGRGVQVNKKYNNTQNNFNLQKQDCDSDDLGYKKGENEINMSRTDGRMLGFLSPIQVGQRNKGKGRNRGNSNDMDDIEDEEITQVNYVEGERGQGEDDEYEEVEEGGKRRRRRKLKKKPLDDIRLPSEHIYLQRLQAPHELKKKNLRKKKKKGTSSMQQLQAMDQDNEVYDLDF